MSRRRKQPGKDLGDIRRRVVVVVALSLRDPPNWRYGDLTHRRQLEDRRRRKCAHYARIRPISRDKQKVAPIRCRRFSFESILDC